MTCFTQIPLGFQTLRPVRDEGNVPPSPDGVPAASATACGPEVPLTHRVPSVEPGAPDEVCQRLAIGLATSPLIQRLGDGCIGVGAMQGNAMHGAMLGHLNEEVPSLGQNRPTARVVDLWI